MAMKSISHGTVSRRIRSAMKKTAPLSSAIRAFSRSGSISTSVTACSSSVCDTLSLHPGRVDDPRHGDDLVPAHDKRPRLALAAGDLGVDENVLDLLPPAREPVARAPGSYLKPFLVGADPPLAPTDLAVERDGRCLHPG